MAEKINNQPVYITAGRIPNLFTNYFCTNSMTVLAGIVGLYVLRSDFISRKYPLLLVLLIHFLAQVIAALRSYGKMTNLHTWFAKIAAFLEGLFFTSAFCARTKLVVFLPGGGCNGPKFTGKNCPGLSAPELESKNKKGFIGY